MERALLGEKLEGNVCAGTVTTAIETTGSTDHTAVGRTNVGKRGNETDSHVRVYGGKGGPG